MILLPAHPASFAIMNERFSKPPIPVENRFCDHCLSEIEDEFHFLIKCLKYNSPRYNLFSVVQLLLIKRYGEI